MLQYQADSCSTSDEKASSSNGDAFTGLSDPGCHFATWAGGSAPNSTNPVRLHFCPDMRRAAFLLTDHGDRTRLPISRALYKGHSDTHHSEYLQNGILATGIKLTQGVFCSGWPGFDYLDNPGFFSLMKEVHQKGVEVCPHNTSEKMDLPPEATRENMSLYAEHFGLESWIDHFRLPTNLTQYGMDPHSPYFILDRFKAYGGSIAWSFVDLYANPPDGELNHFDPPSFRGYLERAFRESMRALRVARIEPRCRASLGALLLKLVGARTIGNLLTILKGFRAVGMRRYLNAFGRLPLNLTYYWLSRLRGRQDAFPVQWDMSSGLYWFDTVRVLFVTDVYTPAALSRLVEQNGIHIGHTYLGFHGSKYDDCGFEVLEDGHYRVRDEFQRFLGCLANRVRDGDIWNPTLRELSAFYRDLSQISLTRPEEHTWVLASEADRVVRGVTLRSSVPLASNPVPASRELPRDNEYWYSFDLQPGASITLSPVSLA